MLTLGWTLLALVASPLVAFLAFVNGLALYRALRLRLAWRRIRVVGNELVRELERSDELPVRRVDQLQREIDLIKKAKAEWL